MREFWTISEDEGFKGHTAIDVNFGKTNREGNHGLAIQVVTKMNEFSTPYEQECLDKRLSLVLAAPDLLDALEDIVKCEINRRNDLATISKKPGSLYDFSNQRVEKAQAAILKARGL